MNSLALAGRGPWSVRGLRVLSGAGILMSVVGTENYGNSLKHLSVSSQSQYTTSARIRIGCVPQPCGRVGRTRFDLRRSKYVEPFAPIPRVSHGLSRAHHDRAG